MALWRKLKSETSSNRQDESSKQRDESQQIAAWQLLYRVQHPARYLSRLQTIPSPDFEPNDPRSTVRGRAAISQVRVLPPPEIAPSGKRGLGSDGRASARPSKQITLFRAFRPTGLPRVIVASTRRDTALEAFRHNPADGSFAPPAPRPSA